jgi:hypothetical protein
LPTIPDGHPIDLGEVDIGIENLPPGSHVAICLSNEPLRRRIQAAFLAEDLPHWLCVYAAQDESLDLVRRELEAAGLPSSATPANMRWATGSELYGDPATPDLRRWKESVHQLFDDMRSARLRGLRWTGDLPIAFARRGLYDNLKALEESVTSQFPGPYTILCTYEDLPASAPQSLRQAFGAHDWSRRLTASPAVRFGSPSLPGP